MTLEIEKTQAAWQRILKTYTLISLLNWGVGMVCCYQYFKYIDKKMSKKHIRGRRLLTERELKKAIKKWAYEYTWWWKWNILLFIPLTERILLPIVAEVRNWLIVGKIGAGKTQFILRLLSALGRRGDRRVITYTSKGDLIQKLYRPGIDLIYNLFDTRTLKWTIFNELYGDETRCILVASCLISESTEEAKVYWFNAQLLFAGILARLWETGRRTNKDVFDAVQSNKKEMQELLAGHASYGITEHDKYTAIVGTMRSSTQIFRYLQDGPFSVKDWFDNGKGWIFLANSSSLEEALRPAISLFIDLVAAHLLDLPDNRNRRCWLIIDEFGSLPRMMRVKKLLLESRSKGGCIVLGLQDEAQMNETWGTNLTRSIIAACGNKAIFSTEDARLAETLAEQIGSEEVERTSKGQMNRHDGPASTASTRRQEEMLVIAGQIMDLPDNTFYLKAAGFSWCGPLQQRAQNYLDKNEMFIRNNILMLNDSEPSPMVTPHKEINIFELPAD